MTVADVKRDQQALQLFMGAAPLEYIRDRLGFKTVTSAQAAVNRAIAVNEKRDARAPLKRLEVERIDAMYQEAWKKAVRGDLKAMDTCLKLSDQRAALLDESTPAELTIAYESTINALDLGDGDTAAIEAGRAVAKQIDHVLMHGTPYERTKALYLLPHLMKVLTDLGATPAARAALQGVAAGSGAPAGEPSKMEVLQRRLDMKVAR